MRHQLFLELSHSPDVESLQRNLVSFAGEFGFGFMSASIITEFPDKSRSFAIVHNAPAGFAEAATKNDANTQRDPVATRAKRESLPFAYDQSTYVESNAGDLWEEQAPYGYKTGIAVSTYLPGSRQFIFGFDRDQPLPTKDDDLIRMFAILQLAAAHAQQAADRLLVSQPPGIVTPELTRREIEILKWTSDGKTAAETAQILCISPHTVTFHVRSILNKLNATNKHQAVRTAMKHGLI